MGCTDKPICIAYTSLISDRYISFILSGTLWYDEPYGKVQLHHWLYFMKIIKEDYFTNMIWRIMYLWWNHWLVGLHLLEKNLFCRDEIFNQNERLIFSFFSQFFFSLSNFGNLNKNIEDNLWQLQLVKYI